MENVKQNLVELKNKFKDEGFYLDFNFYEVNEYDIRIDKFNNDISTHTDKGIKIRIWDNEKFIERGISNVNYDILEKETNNLILEAKNNQKHIKKAIEFSSNKDIIEKDFIVEPKVSFHSMSLEEKVNLLKELRDKAFQLDNDIVNVRVIFSLEEEKRVFVNEYKTLAQIIPLCFVGIVIYVNCEGDVLRNTYNLYVNNGLEVFDKLKSKFDNIKTDIEKLKKAKELKGGKYKVVLAPKVTGLLAHESFGHGLEAGTMIRGRALASTWIGKKIGSENVNIIDYGGISGKWGENYFDAEGNLSLKVYLVKNGIINQPMCDIYSSIYEPTYKQTGNSRFESFDHKNYVRMTNTYFEAGNSEVEDLISKVEDGIYVTKAGGGMEDPKTWGVQIQGCFGQRIKNGKLVDEFYDGFTFTGFLPDIIKNISGISKEVEIDGAGSCGKGHKEWVRVSEGGPHLLIDEVILG